MRAKQVYLPNGDLVPAYWTYVADADIAAHERLVQNVTRKFSKDDSRCSLDPVLGTDDLAQECRYKVFLLLSLQKRVSFTALYNHLRDYADRYYRHADRTGEEV